MNATAAADASVVGAALGCVPSRGRGRSYVVGRVAQMVPTLFLILLTAFVLLQLAPGDMVQVLAGEAGGGSPEYLASLRQSFGLDQPLYMQFLLYIQNVLSGNLGFSFRNNATVTALIGARLGPTLLLAAAGLTVAVVLGVAGGALAAARRGRAADRVIGVVALLIYATPGFLLGIGLMLIFSVALRWLPVGGFVDPYGVDGAWAHALSVARHLVLPAITLGALHAAIYARFTRGAMLEVYGQDHVRTARSKGLSAQRITLRHVLRNALLPLVTVIGMQTGALLGGAILVETVFAWPGLGRLAFEAMQQRDYNLLAGLILCSGTLVVFVNLAVDLLYAVLDPRVRLQ
ncbi:ABC transporter permease [Variovorax arabinosiphilus]|uniref:ABC transporter permease n=1 Tax=Variovorax arabinosiphilus TaxID=3053498 RepID=UPI002578FA66|nr:MULTISPECIES: ABC transporter permease [unclassified Variovorax]MDM0118419.1 ABC transporter permease [Variovorax sp. J2L1-78]MDM0128844.1 ABC transporter permease [Variovorax sp. J2L1-63]MDM0233370.1 ABC transporter permease [Variovorax sp. J2R1-6]